MDELPQFNTNIFMIFYLGNFNYLSLYFIAITNLLPPYLPKQQKGLRPYIKLLGVTRFPASS